MGNNSAISATTQDARRTHGLANGGYDRGMNTLELRGEGFQVLQNAFIKDGRIETTPGNEEFYDFGAGVDSVDGVRSFEKDDGTFQRVCFIERDGVFRVRFIEDDATETSPAVAHADAVALTGTITFSNGSAAVSASGGAFTTELTAGDYIYYATEHSDRQRVLSITDDDNLTLEAVYGGTGGAGTGNFSGVQFPNAEFGWVQIGTSGYLSVNDTAANGNLWYWDETLLTAITSAPDNPTALGRNGARLSLNAGGVRHFSRADQSPITSWTGGATVFTEGNYVVNQPGSPTAAVQAGSGEIVGFRNGYELHQVNELTDGSGLFSATRVGTFTSTGSGVSAQSRLRIGKFFVYGVNAKGIDQINPQTGTTRNLIEENGAIGRYWSTFNLDNAAIHYIPNEEIVVVAVSSDDTGSNDILVCYQEADKNINRPESFFIKDAHAKSLGLVDNQLYGGSSTNGKLYKLFTPNQYLGDAGENFTTRMVKEWDNLGTMKSLKAALRFFSTLEGDDNAEIELNFYTDGDSETPIVSRITTIKSIGTLGEITEAFGDYTMGVGGTGQDEASLQTQRDDYNKDFFHYCWEIKYTSADPLKVWEDNLDFLALQEVDSCEAFANKLFTLS